MLFNENRLYKNKSNYAKKNYIIVNLIIVSIFISLFSFGKTKVDPIFGTISFCFLGFLSILILTMNNNLNRLNAKLLFLFSILVVFKLCFFSILTIRSVVQLFVILMLLVSISEVQIDKKLCKLFSHFHLFFNCLGIISYFLSEDKNFFIFFGSTNTFAGAFLFILMCSIVLNNFFSLKWKFLINAIITITFIFLLHSRTSFIIMVFLFLIYVFVRLICKSVKKSEVFFIAFIMILFIVTLCYINIQQMPFYDFLNSFSIKYFNKNIDSGRPDIWKSILLNNNGFTFFFGKGNVHNITGELSAHNQFMQIFAENGIVGLFIFISILTVIWNRYAQFSKDKIIKLCMTFMIAIIIYNCFETSLIQNKFAIGCFEWTILAIGLGRANWLEKNK